MLTYHLLFDPEGNVRKTYEVWALPVTYIIGRDGKIVGKINGARDWNGTAGRALVEYLLRS